MSRDGGWHLGIDYGTTYTVAAVAKDQTVTVIDVESNGRSRMPSSVFLNQDGRILVGRAAVHQASFAPERFEAAPKRLFGEGQLFLGDRLVEVTDLASATILRAYHEACLYQGNTAPEVVRVTHPAGWSDTRLGVLKEAVEKAGVAEYELIPEPVAAAARIGLLATRPGDMVAVYDFGGGTFDAAVLRRTEGGFEIAGPPVGRDQLGGEEIDRLLLQHLAAVLADGFEEEWKSLLSPPDAAWRRRAMELRAEVQRTKETLSEATVCQLWLPGLERDAQLTRDELNELIRADVESTVDTLEAAFDGAGVRAADLAGIYLVGGSSRIPLVADAILARTGMVPSVQENPKSIVAMGAAGWDLLSTARQTGADRITVTMPETEATLESVAVEVPVTRELNVVPGFQADGVYQSRLVMAVGKDAWPDGSACVAEIEIDRRGAPPLTIRVRNDPARTGSSAEQAEIQGASRAQRTAGYVDQGVAPATVFGQPGVERRFSMLSGRATIDMVERYLTRDGRSLTVAVPAEAVATGDGIELLDARPPTGAFFEVPLTVMVPSGWTVTERLTLRRNGSRHSVQSVCTTLPAHIGWEGWRDQVLRDAASGRAQAAFAASVSGPVLNRFDGEVVGILWNREQVAMMTKVGLSVAGALGYMVTISLPRTEQSQFASLARQARVRADEE